MICLRLETASYVIYKIVADALLVQVVQVTPHDYRKNLMRHFSPAKKRIAVSPGESVRIIRELQGLSQTQLAALCGIPQTTISSIENSRVNLGVERAKVLALALRCHRRCFGFPGLASSAGVCRITMRATCNWVRPSQAFMSSLLYDVDCRFFSHGRRVFMVKLHSSVRPPT
jgi:transcriptional regulator with XRE-family HTH domain